VNNMTKIAALDLFAGAGGLSQGMLEAGIAVKGAVDFWKPAVETHAKNHTSIKCITADLTKTSPEELFNELGLSKDDIDIIVGGPPCQGFSTVGNRNVVDPKNQLFLRFVDIVEYAKPPAFVMENVKGILSMKSVRGNKVSDEVVSGFSKLGYSVSFKLLNAANFGTPQIRERVFFVGIEKSLKKQPTFPKITHSEYQTDLHGNRYFPLITCWDALSDLPPLEAGEGAEEMGYTQEPKNDYQRNRRKDSSKLFNHSAPKHSKKVIDRISKIPPGGNYSSLPPEEQNISGYPNIYGRLIADAPAGTIIGNCGCVSAPGRFVHPFKNRGITVREAARLQSFPDKFRFFGSNRDQYLQVGNAVPVMLAKAVTTEVSSVLLENK